MHLRKPVIIASKQHIITTITGLDAVKRRSCVHLILNRKLLFSTYISQIKAERYSDEDILQIIEEGCELEDIFRYFRINLMES